MVEYNYFCIIKKGEEVKVEKWLGPTAQDLFTSIGKDLYRADETVYVTGEKVDGEFIKLYQARKVEEGRELSNVVKAWPRLRVALHKAEVKAIHVPGGDSPIHYQGEFCIPDFRDQGSYFFVVPKEEIKKYLELVPLDEDAAKRHSETIEQGEKNQKLTSLTFAKEIGKKFWEAGAFRMDGEFKRITIYFGDGNFSRIYPLCKTDLMWHEDGDVARIIYEGNDKGITYLSAATAAGISPKLHKRIKLIQIPEKDLVKACLMPNKKLAEEVGKGTKWSWFFTDYNLADQVAASSKIVMENFDLYDKIVSPRLVYKAETGNVEEETIE